VDWFPPHTADQVLNNQGFLVIGRLLQPLAHEGIGGAAGGLGQGQGLGRLLGQGRLTSLSAAAAAAAASSAFCFSIAANRAFSASAAARAAAMAAAFALAIVSRILAIGLAAPLLAIQLAAAGGVALLGGGLFHHRAIAFRFGIKIDIMPGAFALSDIPVEQWGSFSIV
jgi:hypothetical protein